MLRMSLPSVLCRAIAIAAIVITAGLVPLSSPAQAANNCYASGSGKPFCTAKPCPKGYKSSGLINAGCVSGQYYLCCKEKSLDARTKAYQCQQLYCSKVCGKKDTMGFCRPKGMSFWECQAKCNNL